MKLSARLALLESTARPAGGGVVTYAWDEAPEDALCRAYAAGRTGGVLLAPQAMTVEQWESLAASSMAVISYTGLT